MSHKTSSVVSILFLALEAVLYYFILTAGGDLLVYSSFFAIVLCFLHILLHVKTCNKWIFGGLACTVMADFCLVVCSPIQQLWGMVFFLIAQSLYAANLHLASRNKLLLYIRIVLILIALSVTGIVLKENTDALALVSLCYYANLIMNIVVAFARFKTNKMLSIALVLFLLCDTVIGLRVACGAYLPIGEESLIYKIIFMPFNLSWLFYLPSQVLISLSGKRK